MALFNNVILEEFYPLGLSHLKWTNMERILRILQVVFLIWGLQKVLFVAPL
mgnify:CR=1 FL=1